MNSELVSTQSTIIFRPELELARPMYYTDTDDVFYIQSIDHTININGDATTTVNGNFGRKEKDIPPDLHNFLLATESIVNTAGKLATPPPTLEQILAQFPNVEDAQEELNRQLQYYYDQNFCIGNTPILDWIDELYTVRKELGVLDEKTAIQTYKQSNDFGNA